MRMRDHRASRALLRAGSVAAAVCGLALSGSMAGAEQDVLLTAVKGDASAESQELSPRSPVADGHAIETGDGGSLAVLIDRNAVVEMCGHSRVSFTRDGANRVVRVDAGTVKLVVEPRAPGERMEIHTPTAIATILGTVVYVTVDPVTGETTVASVEHQVNVRIKADGSDPTGTTIDTNEQVTVGAPGAAPQGKRALDPKQLETLEACLADFHDLAVESDRIPVMARSADRAAQQDASAGSVPPVSARPPGAPGEPGTDPTNTPFTPLVGAPPPPPPVDPPSDSSNF